MPSEEKVVAALEQRRQNMQRLHPGYSQTDGNSSQQQQRAGPPPPRTPRKRRTNKCQQCRRDKKRCLPDPLNQTEWPNGSCERCKRLGHPCGVKRIAHDDPSFRSKPSKRSRDLTSDDSSPEDGETALPRRPGLSAESSGLVDTSFSSSQGTVGASEDYSFLDDLEKWQKHQQRHEIMKTIVTKLSARLGTLRETSAKCRDHKHKPPTLKPSECPECIVMLTLSRSCEILQLIDQLRKTAQEAIEDNDHSQVELLLLKAQGAHMDWCKYSDGEPYEDDKTTLITLELITFYQKHERHTEAEVYIELLAKRKKGTPSLSKEDAQKVLVQSLKKTTDELNRPMNPLMDYVPCPEVRIADFGSGIPFPLFWRAYSRKVHLPLPDVDTLGRDTHGNTALHEAIRHENLKAVQELVSAGVDMMARNKDHQTPLDVACVAGLLPVVEILIKHQQNVDDSRTFGDDASYSVHRRSGLTSMLEPDVFRNASTPLHSAIENRWPDIVDCLIKAGATVSEVTRVSDNRTAIELAQYMVEQKSGKPEEEERSMKILQIIEERNQNYFFSGGLQENFFTALGPDDHHPFLGNKIGEELGAYEVPGQVGVD